MATLVRYPGGKNNKGNYNKAGPYYVRIWLPNLKKIKIFCTHTENKKEAERKLKIVEDMEWMIKAERSLLLTILSEHKNDSKLLNSINIALGRDTSLTIEKSIALYLDSCKKRISKSTVKTYALALRDFKRAVGSHTRVTELCKGDYEKLLNYLTDHYNDTTVNIRLRGIRAFLCWLVENDYLEKMPFKVKMVKLPNALPKFLTPAEVEAIYSHVDDPVLVSIFKVYEGTGMRLSELQSSKLEGGFLRVVGKGNKERIVPIPETLIHDYHVAKQANYKTDRITKAFTKARRKAGIAENKTLHSLRHTYALRMLVELGDIFLVQKLLGHSSVTVTEIYTKFPRAYLKQIFESKNRVYNNKAVA